jgi:hypothetical protein
MSCMDEVFGKDTAETYLSVAVELGLKFAAAVARLVLKAAAAGLTVEAGDARRAAGGAVHGRGSGEPGGELAAGGPTGAARGAGRAAGGGAGTSRR